MYRYFNASYLNSGPACYETALRQSRSGAAENGSLVPHFQVTGDRKQNRKEVFVSWVETQGQMLRIRDQKIWGQFVSVKEVAFVTKWVDHCILNCEKSSHSKTDCI